MKQVSQTPVTKTSKLLEETKTVPSLPKEEEKKEKKPVEVVTSKETELRNIKKKYFKHKIYMFPCNRCMDGLQALHLTHCINRKCNEENPYFDKSLNVSEEVNGQFIADIREAYRTPTKIVT